MWSWSSSEATYESKAFQYWAPKSMLAVPLSTYRYGSIYEDGTYRYAFEHISKLMLVKVNESDGHLSLYGEVNQSSLYDEADERLSWRGGEQNIRRSVFMGDFVYAFSPGGITVTNLTTMEESDRLSIPRSFADDRFYVEDSVKDDASDEPRRDESGEDDPEREGDEEDRPEEHRDDHGESEEERSEEERDRESSSDGSESEPRDV